MAYPDELIINIDQTPSKFVPTENITMNAKRRKTRISKRVETTKDALLLSFVNHLMELCLLFN